MDKLLRFFKPKFNQKGFSLLELLIALSILAIGLLMLTGMQFATIRANSNGLKMSTAVTLGESLMERLKLLAPNDPQLIAGTYNGNITVGGVSYFPVTLKEVDYIGSYTVTDNTPTTIIGLKRVDLNVTWVDNGNHTVTLTGRFSP